jgi:hypothetical protein
MTSEVTKVVLKLGDVDLRVSSFLNSGSSKFVYVSRYWGLPQA